MPAHCPPPARKHTQCWMPCGCRTVYFSGTLYIRCVETTSRCCQGAVHVLIFKPALSGTVGESNSQRGERARQGCFPHCQIDSALCSANRAASAGLKRSRGSVCLTENLSAALSVVTVDRLPSQNPSSASAPRKHSLAGDAGMPRVHGVPPYWA